MKQMVGYTGPSAHWAALFSFPFLAPSGAARIHVCRSAQDSGVGRGTRVHVAALIRTSV